MTPLLGRIVPACLALLIVPAGGRSDAGQSPVFRGGIDAVSVDVSVTRGGRPVAGLTPGDFIVTDDGVRQEVTDLSFGEQAIDLTVVLDVSWSVSGAVIERLRRAVSELGAHLKEDDRLRVITFNVRIRRILDVGDPPAAADASFAEMTPSGSSAVLDALAVALVSPAISNRRQFVVLFSDGTDNASITSAGTIVDIARRASPTVSVVLAVPYEQAPHDVYRALALQTGGTVVSLPPNESLGDRLRRVLDEFRSSYVLTYSPSGPDRPGAHAIDVQVDRPDVTVRARRGYVVR